jgi:hypothetical protein
MANIENGGQREDETDDVVGQRSGWRTRIRVPLTRLRGALRGSRLVLWVGMLIAAMTALWLTAGVWGGRLPTGDDTIAHVIRTKFAIENLISEGRTDGWAPSFLLGYETFLFSGPAFAWAVALVRVLSFGLLSVAGAFKVVFVGSFVALPLTVAFLARSFGLERRTAGVAAILTLVVNSPYGGVGLSGLFGIGLATHQFGAIFFFLALGSAVRLLRHPSARWTVLTAGSVAILLTAHGLSVFIFVVLLGVILVAMVIAPRPEREDLDLVAIVRREVAHRLGELGIGGTEEASADDEPAKTPPSDAPSLSAVLHLTLAMALAGGLAAFVVLPLLVHRELQVSFSSWGTPTLSQRITDIWHGLILFRPGVASLVLAGFVFGLWRAYQGRRLAFLLIAVPPVFLVIAHVSFSLWPTNVIPTQLTTRALGYIGVLAILPLASLIGWIGGRFGRFGGPVAFGLALAVVIVPLGTDRQAAGQIDAPVPSLAEAARQLASRVPDGARFVTERDISDERATTNLGAPHFWLAWASGRATLNSYNLESSTTPGAAQEADSVGQRPPEVVADGLSRLGVTHLVTLSDDAANRFTSSERFSEVWRSSPVAIFGVSPRSGQPDPATLVTANAPIQAEMLRAEPEQLVIQVNPSSSVQATVAIGWSPKWHAQLDGEPVALGRASDGLLQLDLPAGVSQLVIEFRPDAWDRLGLGISLITVTLLCGWYLRRRQRLRQAQLSSDRRTNELSDRSVLGKQPASDRAPAPVAGSGKEEAAGQDT